MTKIKPRLIARISCQECRRRKTRCNFDGQSQKCSTCARIGTACIFSQKNGVVLDIDKVMEENNPHLVHQREKEQRAKDRAKFVPNSISSSSSSNLTSPPLAPSSDISIYSKSTPAPSFLTGGQYHTNRPSRSNSTSSAAYRNGSSSTEDLSNVLDRLQIDAFGIAPHTLRSFSQVAGDNDSAQVSESDCSDDEDEDELSEVHNGSQEQGGSGSAFGANKRNSSGSNSGTQQYRGHRSSRSRSVPLVDIQPDLIDLYFKHVHPFLLVLHKPSFIRRLYDPKDPVPDFLLAAMYAVALHYAPGREEEGRRYFDFWLSRLDSAFDKPRLSTIQSLLMIIKYQEGVRQPGFYFRTYMYTQMVIVLARELQLHKTTPVNAKLDPESHEVRRRLFWAIFVLDQFMSVSQGRTMSFREVEPEADLPGIDNEDPKDLEEIEYIQNAVEYIKLVKIDHQAHILVRKFLTKVVTPEETIPQGLFLHQAMLTWKANLPARLQLAPNMSPHTPFVAMLHVLYHACAIMIQRCYGDDPSVSHLEISSVARETCSVSANNITVIIDDLFTNHGMVPMTYPIRGCYFVIYCLIAAATIQVNDVRRGVNGPIIFKRSLALLNHFLRTSTAVDIEREVELLKSSMDTAMEGHSYADSNSPTPHYDHRPPLKPILPMSGKHGSKLSFNSTSVTPVRPRKISPKSGHADTSRSGSAPSEARDHQTESSHSGMDGTPTSAFISNSSATASSSQSPSSQNLDDDLDVSIKSSPSPDMSSRSISSALSNNGSSNNSNSDPAFLRSVQTFSVPASLPSDFTAFAQAQQQALAASGTQGPPPLGSLAQFLSYQQDQQRLQLHKQQQLSTLEQLSAAQMQQQHRVNQQRQVLLLQQQQQQQQQRHYQALQQQQQQDPALFNNFLNNFSNLNNYQQLNSDQAQNELLSMLDSSMFNYNDSNTYDLTNDPSQDQQEDASSSLSPSSTSISGGYSPNSNLSTFGTSLYFPPHQQQDRQRSILSDESAMGDAALAVNHMHDASSPETFPIIDMASSYPSYLGLDNTVPFGVRQAIGEAEKIFKFQAQAGLTSD